MVIYPLKIPPQFDRRPKKDAAPESSANLADVRFESLVDESINSSPMSAFEGQADTRMLKVPRERQPAFGEKRPFSGCRKSSFLQCADSLMIDYHVSFQFWHMQIGRSANQVLNLLDSNQS